MKQKWKSSSRTKKKNNIGRFAYSSPRISRLCARFFITSRLSDFFRMRPSPSSSFTNPFFMKARSGIKIWDLFCSAPVSSAISDLVSNSRRARSSYNPPEHSSVDMAGHASLPSKPRRRASKRVRRRSETGRSSRFLPHARAVRCPPYRFRRSRNRSARGDFRRYRA